MFARREQGIQKRPEFLPRMGPDGTGWDGTGRWEAVRGYPGGIFNMRKPREQRKAGMKDCSVHTMGPVAGQRCHFGKRRVGARGLQRSWLADKGGVRAAFLWRE